MKKTITNILLTILLASTVSGVFIDTSFAQLSPNSCPSMDIDGDGQVQAFLDGIVLNRLLTPNFLDANVLNSVTQSTSAVRTSVSSMRSFVEANKSRYDFDGDGKVSAAVDGLLALRYQLGITDSGLITGIKTTASVNKINDRIKAVCALPVTVASVNTVSTDSIADTNTVLKIDLSAPAPDPVPIPVLTSTPADSTDTVGDAADDSISDTVCVDLQTNLKYKSKDTASSSDVSDLQDFLNIYGYLLSEPSGYYGRTTVSAVKKFQSANGLVASGVVGVFTRAKIKSISCSDSPVTAVDDGVDKVLSQSQIIKNSPRISAGQVPPTVLSTPTQSIKTLPVRSVSALKVESISLAAESMTLQLRAAVSDDTVYIISVYYKNSSRTCMLSAGFSPIARQLYTIDRTTYSICKNGNILGDFSTIDYIAVEKK